MIRKASGKKEASKVQTSSRNGTSGTSSLVGRGATLGCRIDRPMT